jgi:hypothetical protein
VTEPHNPDAAFYARTGHCGLCGQPGEFCLCWASRPCGCRELHEMGSGRRVDPLEVFADPAGLVQGDQGDLW